MEIYSRKENADWYDEQSAARVIEQAWDLLTENGRQVVRALLEINTFLSFEELEERTGLKHEDLKQALKDAEKLGLYPRDTTGKIEYTISPTYRIHLQRIVEQTP